MALIWNISETRVDNTLACFIAQEISKIRNGYEVRKHAAF
jgi:hypothetical protein